MTTWATSEVNPKINSDKRNVNETESIGDLPEETSGGLHLAVNFHELVTGSFQALDKNTNKPLVDFIS